jgi:hypothetical protein
MVKISFIGTSGKGIRILLPGKRIIHNGNNLTNPKDIEKIFNKTITAGSFGNKRLICDLKSFSEMHGN